MTEPGTDSPQSDTAGNTHGLGPGAELARHRESRGWTIDHVARQLNLAPRQIQALEADNHTALPGIASVRGFIRAYAKLLKIEPEPLLASISNQPEILINEPIPMRPALSAPFSESSRFSSGRGWPWKNTLLIAFMAAVLIGAYVGDREGWFQTKEPTVSFRKAAIPPPVQEAAPAAEQTAQLSPSAPSVSTPAPEASEPAQGAALQEAKETPGKSPASLAAATPPAAAAEPIAASPAAQGELVVSVREQSWLDVRRVGKNGKAGEVLASHLAPAGTTESFDMSQPVNVVIGNTHGVDVQLRGQAVALKPIGKTNVSRLTLK